MSTIRTTDTAAAWSPDVYSYAPADVVPQALILNTSTVSGTIEGDEPSLRVAYVADSESADYVAEGAVIPDQEGCRVNRLIGFRTLSVTATSCARPGGVPVLDSDSCGYSAVTALTSASAASRPSLCEASGLSPVSSFRSAWVWPVISVLAIWSPCCRRCSATSHGIGPGR